MNMKTRRLLAATAAPLLFAAVANAQEPAHALPDPGPRDHVLYRAADVAWRAGPGSLEPGARMAILEGDPSQPGIFTMRILMPDGFRIAPHWHPNPERVTVVSGTFRLGAGDVLNAGATTPLGAGSYTAMPPGMRHYAIADGETVIQLTSVGPWEITYVKPADDPRGRK
jgi:quercetin dioxygenase-like cupin family protein